MGNGSITEGLSVMITEETILHYFNSILWRVTVTAQPLIYSSNVVKGRTFDENKENLAQHKLIMLRYYVHIILTIC